MSYQGRRRAPRKRLRDRIRTWWYGKEEEQELIDDHGNDIGGDLPPVQRWPGPEGRVWQAARLGDGTLLPLDGEPSPLGYNPAWAPCAFRQDAWPSGVRREGRAFHGLNHAPGMPRPGTWYGGDAEHNPTGPGHLSMWDLVHVRSPWPPRTWPPVLSGPRIRPELRTALLAGTT